MGRAPCCEKIGLNRGPWSTHEDKLLITYINENGYANWRSLPKKAGLLRCGKSCRLRWTNYLRPDIKRGNFTKEEEDTIIELHKELGNKWSAIATSLPGRTDNEIKNVWNTHLRKRLVAAAGDNNQEPPKTKKRSKKKPNKKIDPPPQEEHSDTNNISSTSNDSSQISKTIESSSSSSSSSLFDKFQSDDFWSSDEIWGVDCSSMEIVDPPGAFDSDESGLAFPLFSPFRSVVDGGVDLWYDCFGGDPELQELLGL